MDLIPTGFLLLLLLAVLVSFVVFVRRYNSKFRRHEVLLILFEAERPLTVADITFAYDDRRSKAPNVWLTQLTDLSKWFSVLEALEEAGLASSAYAWVPKIGNPKQTKSRRVYWLTQHGQQVVSDFSKRGE